MNNFTDKIIDRIYNSVCKQYAVKAEQWAKANRPWKDQTGDARKKLKGIPFRDNNSVGIQLVHRVEYGKHLETANDGRYAILKPTIEALRPEFMSALQKCLGGKR